MHVRNEIFAERYQEKYPQDTTQQRAQKDLQEVGRQSRNDIKGGQGKYHAGHHRSRAGSDRLYNDILAQTVFALESGRKPHGYDGNRYGSLKNLSHLQPQVGRCGRKQYGHKDTPGNRPGSNLPIDLVGRHDGVIGLSLLQFAKRVLRQIDRLFLVFFHRIIFMFCFSPK